MPTHKLKLIKFTAAWCGPCQSMEPALQAALEERPKVEYQKVDVDTVRGGKLADEYDVSGIPALFLVRGKERLWRSVGAIGKRAILNAIDKFG